MANATFNVCLEAEQQVASHDAGNIRRHADQSESHETFTIVRNRLRHACSTSGFTGLNTKPSQCSPLTSPCTDVRPLTSPCTDVLHTGFVVLSLVPASGCWAVVKPNTFVMHWPKL